MVMSKIWTGMIFLSIVFSLWTSQGNRLSGAVMEGAQAGIQLSISMAGAICLWSGVARLLQAGGIHQRLARCTRPLLGKIFPEAQEDPVLAGDISANICANLLGLGNAATPLGIRAAKGFCKHGSASASDSLCRLVVLNTASIQLIPTTVAAIRASLGCQHPFDILPAVWITSFLSAGLGLAGAVLLGKVYSHD